ncbi:cytochrome c550 [Jeotgalibacillus sp. R-1-5s-1]|uniref:cytochrome c550 n=1 Tax=Jeotgalibacillus sp. R-1-5s-1 TaxID=2555897 RepID=UPI0010699BDB|nr:cytochrome c [Jeotgalibacillus sp. R-1-5s-1]
MNKNPIIPFLLIMVLGFGVVFFMSVQGLDDSEEMAQEEEGGGEGEGGGEAAGDFDPEATYQNACISCHGENYEGGSGFPSLVGVGERLSVDEIANILVNGQGAMPAGLVEESNAQAMAEWVAEIGAEGGGEEGAEEGSEEGTEEGSEEGGSGEETEEGSEEDAA